MKFSGASSPEPPEITLISLFQSVFYAKKSLSTANIQIWDYLNYSIFSRSTLVFAEYQAYWISSRISSLVDFSSENSKIPENSKIHSANISVKI